LSFLIQHKKLDNELYLGQSVEVINRKMEALQNLIDENIVKQTSTLNQGKISEFPLQNMSWLPKILINKP